MTFCARPAGIFYRVIDPLPAASVTIGGGSQGTVKIDWTFRTDGKFNENLNDDVQNLNLVKDWYIPTQAVTTDHWVRLTVTAGTDPNGTDSLLKDTWYRLNASRKFQWERSTSGTTTATVTLEISSDSGGSTIVGTKTGLVVTLDYT